MPTLDLELTENQIKNKIYGGVPTGTIVAIHPNTDLDKSLVTDTNGDFYWKICDTEELVQVTFEDGSKKYITKPNLSDDKFLMGVSSGVSTGGSNSVTLSLDNLPEHSHTIPDHSHSVTFTLQGKGSNPLVSLNSHTHITQRGVALPSNIAGGSNANKVLNANTSVTSGDPTNLGSLNTAHNHTKSDYTLPEVGEYSNYTGNASPDPLSMIPLYFNVKFVIKVM
jgi:microcystin-dependent protein